MSGRTIHLMGRLKKKSFGWDANVDLSAGGMMQDGVGGGVWMGRREKAKRGRWEMGGSLVPSPRELAAFLLREGAVFRLGPERVELNHHPPNSSVPSHALGLCSLEDLVLTALYLSLPFQTMAPSKPATSKTGVEGTKKKRGGEKGEFTLKRVKGMSTHHLYFIA